MDTDRLKAAAVIYAGGAVMGAAIHDWFEWHVLAPWPVWGIAGLLTSGAVAYALRPTPKP